MNLRIESLGVPIGFVLALIVLPHQALSHLSGRIGVDHYIRIIPKQDVLEVEYNVHLGEEPTESIRARLDHNNNCQLDTDEMMEYVRKATPVYARKLKVQIGAGNKQDAVYLELPSGGIESNSVARVIRDATGFETFRIRWRFEALWPAWVLADQSLPVDVRVRRPISMAMTTASWIFVTGQPPSPIKILSSDVPSDLEVPLPPDEMSAQSDASKVPVATGAHIVCRLKPAAGPVDETRQGVGLETTASFSLKHIAVLLGSICVVTIAIVALLRLRAVTIDRKE